MCTGTDRWPRCSGAPRSAAAATTEAPAANTNFAVPKPFMWNRGAAISSRSFVNEPARLLCSNGPELTIVRERHTLRPARRARGVEHHGRLTGLRPHGLEGARIEQRLEAVRAWIVEADGRNARRERGATLGVVEDGLDGRIAHDVADGIRRKAEVHRHGDEPRPHRAQVGDQEFGAIGGKDGDGAAAREPRFKSPRAQASASSSIRA